MKEIDNKTAELLLEILEEINRPSVPTDRRVDECSCGCGAWKEKGTPRLYGGGHYLAGLP